MRRRAIWDGRATIIRSSKTRVSIWDMQNERALTNPVSTPDPCLSEIDMENAIMTKRISKSLVVNGETHRQRSGMECGAGSQA